MYKVFVVEDEFVIREGIRNMMNYNNMNYTLCGEAADGEMALAMIQELHPDILITDIKMPFMDGLELSKIIKRTMPWIRIIILSGYDEFDFARDAISIGVDEYLLKPVGASELFAILNKVIVRIEEEKKQRTDIEILHRELDSSIHMTKNQFLDKLIMGALSTTDSLEGAQKADIDLIARYYVLLNAQIDFNGASYSDLLEAKACISRLFKDRTDVIPFFRNEDNFLVIIKGTTKESIDQGAYELANLLKHEYESKTDAVLTIGIGSITDRIGEISKSFMDSKKAIKFLSRFKQGQIIGINDIEREPLKASYIVKEHDSIEEKLKYASRKDIPDIISQYTKGISQSNSQSVLFTYYILMDIVIASSRLITELEGDANSIIPEADNLTLLFDIACLEETFTAFVISLLERVIDFRDSCGDMRYGNVIRKARKYINENYSSSVISLNTVAAEVALSPNHFSTIFSQETGETFIEYLTRIRIEKAKDLLAATSMRLSDIASAVGYNESHYFSYLFKKNVGISAREYRTNHTRI
ncbi:MAG: two component transcriptional regulator, AraC family [Clostridia bacterium]|jgi:two-component system response regulator YesN|nr:two component transcriptional regulator, AraC family [Clostridia bacterium]